jgi:hypothetical protein
LGAVELSFQGLAAAVTSGRGGLADEKALGKMASLLETQTDWVDG